MVERREEPDFGFLAFELVGVRSLRGEELQGHVPAEVFVPGRVDR